MNANAVMQVFFHFLAIRTRELSPLHEFLDTGLFSRRAEVETHKVLRSLGGIILREVDEINGCFILSDQFLQRHIHRSLDIAELKRHRTLSR